MTVDNSVTHVRYGGVDLVVSGELDDWRRVKTFSFTPIRGAKLEIGGYEHADCEGCECSGLLLECDNGLVSDLVNWKAVGGSSSVVAPSSGYQEPCQSSSGFYMDQSFENAMTKIWTPTGEKYVWFRTNPYEGK